MNHCLSPSGVGTVVPSRGEREKKNHVLILIFIKYIINSRNTIFTEILDEKRGETFYEKGPIQKKIS